MCVFRHALLGIVTKQTHSDLALSAFMFHIFAVVCAAEHSPFSNHSK